MMMGGLGRGGTPGLVCALGLLDCEDVGKIMLPHRIYDRQEKDSRYL